MPLLSKGESDVFVARLTGDGALAWVKTFGAERDLVGEQAGERHVAVGVDRDRVAALLVGPAERPGAADGAVGADPDQHRVALAGRGPLAGGAEGRLGLEVAADVDGAVGRDGDGAAEVDLLAADAGAPQRRAEVAALVGGQRRLRS